MKVILIGLFLNWRKSQNLIVSKNILFIPRSDSRDGFYHQDVLHITPANLPNSCKEILPTNML